RPARTSTATVREEELGMAARAEVDALDDGDARASQRALGGGPQVELPPGCEVGVEERRDLVAHLVAARPDRGTDHGGSLTVDRLDAGGDDPFREAAPARMENGSRRSPSVRAIAIG